MILNDFLREQMYSRVIFILFLMQRKHCNCEIGFSGPQVEGVRCQTLTELNSGPISLAHNVQ